MSLYIRVRKYKWIVENPLSDLQLQFLDISNYTHETAISPCKLLLSKISCGLPAILIYETTTTTTDGPRILDQSSGRKTRDWNENKNQSIFFDSTALVYTYNQRTFTETRLFGSIYVYTPLSKKYISLLYGISRLVIRNPLRRVPAVAMWLTAATAQCTPHARSP